MESVERILAENGEILAIIVRAGTQTEELNFVTPKEFPLQLGVHNRENNVICKPHKHKPFNHIDLLNCQEFFYIESGKMEITIYDPKDKPFCSVILNKGDFIILNSGHGIKFLEKTKAIEIKQGPYRGTAEEKEFIGGN